jgi:hypothetical protein
MFTVFLLHFQTLASVVSRSGLAIWHFWQMPEGPVFEWADRVFVKRQRII